MNLHHVTISQALAFIERHGYALLFLWVLVEQSAIPLPSIPLLLGGGALIRTGRLHLAPALACCVSAALLADSMWFQLGRRKGRRVLALICRVSLEPDSCVRQTENAFVKYGMKSLLFAKFIPGLNAVAAPLAGNSRSFYRHFLLYDAAGAALWSGFYIALGFLFSTQLEMLLSYTSTMGSGLLLLVSALFVLWVVRKYVQRRVFLKQLRVDRITAEELQTKLAGGEDVVVVDLRNELPDEAPEIPGAIRLRAEELPERSAEIPRDREIVLFCS